MNVHRFFMATNSLIPEITFPSGPIFHIWIVVRVIQTRCRSILLLAEPSFKSYMAHCIAVLSLRVLLTGDWQDANYRITGKPTESFTSANASSPSPYLSPHLESTSESCGFPCDDKFSQYQNSYRILSVSAVSGFFKYCFDFLILLHQVQLFCTHVR